MKKMRLFLDSSWSAKFPIILVALLTITFSAHAEEGQMCVVKTGTWLGVPVVDGVVERFPVSTARDPSGYKSDPGWDGATKFNMSYANQQGTATGAIPSKLLVTDTTDALYLGIVIQVDALPFVGPSENDIVVLALSTDSHPDNDWRIHIVPFSSSQISQDFESSNPDAVAAWRNSDNWNDDPDRTEITPSWISPSSGNIKIAKAGSMWSLEIKIPKNTDPDKGINLPTDTSSFRLYANIISTSSIGIGQGAYVQDPWPTWQQSAIRQVSSPPFTIERNTPPKDRQNGISGIVVSGIVATATFSSVSHMPFYVGDPVTISGLAGYSGAYRISALTSNGFIFDAPGAVSVSGSGRATVPAWGTASLTQRPECTGISIAQNDIGVGIGAALSSEISVYKPSNSAENYPTSYADCETKFLANPTLQTLMGPANTFVAKTKNSSSHAPNDLKATFRLSQFGISATLQFKAIGPEVFTLPVNLPPAGTISSPGSGKTMETRQFNWLESCQYMLAYIDENNNPHQCLLVELDSTDPEVRFLNRSIWRNMLFKTASRMEESATISAKGLGTPVHGQKHQFLLRVNSELQSFDREKPKLTQVRDDSESAYAEHKNNQKKHWTSLGSEEILRQIPVHYPRGVSEAMLWTVHGFLSNGNYLEIRGKRFQEAQFLGGFGYVAGHDGIVTDWQWKFQGSQMKEVTRNQIYALELAPENETIVTTTILAEETITDVPQTWWHWFLLILIILLILFILFWRKPKQP